MQACEINNKQGVNVVTTTQDLDDKNSAYVCFCFGLLIYIYHASELLHDISSPWYTSGCYNFSYIILFISITWVIKNLIQSYNNKHCIIMPSILSLLGVLFCVIVVFIAYILQLSLIIHAMTVMLLWFILYACFGREIALNNLKPFLLFLFTIPLIRVFEHQIIEIVKLGLIQVLSFFGILVNYNHELLESDNIVISVNSTFSGIRTINAILVISFLYGIYVFKKKFVRIIYIFLCLSLAVVFNLLRISALILLANSYGVDYIQLYLSYYNWASYFVLLVIIFIIPVGLKKFDELGNDKYIFKYTNLSNITLGTKSCLVLNLSIILLLLHGFSYFRGFYENVVYSIPSYNDIKTPPLIHTWQSCEACMYNNWFPKAGNPDVKFVRTYAHEILNKHVDLYMGYYEHQYVGNSLISFKGDFDYSSPWKVTNVNQKKVKINYLKKERSMEYLVNGKIKVVRVLLNNKESNQNRVIWYWFWVGGKKTSNRFYAKYLEFLDVIKTFRTHSALIAISANYINESELYNAETALYVFMNDNYDSLYPKTTRTAILI